MNELHTTTVTDGLAAVERSVAVKDAGVLVTLTITTDAPGETAVMVTDTTPSAVDATESGFHPNFSPDEGSVNADRVVFAETITAAAPLQIIYGMVVDAETVSAAWDHYSLSLDAVAPEPSAVGPNGRARSYADGEFATDEPDDHRGPGEDADPARREVADIEPSLDPETADGVSAGHLFERMETADMSPDAPADSDPPEEPAAPLIAEDGEPNDVKLEAAVRELDPEERPDENPDAPSDDAATASEEDGEPVVSLDDLVDADDEGAPDAEPDEPRPGDGAGDALEEPADDGEESADEPESADESAEESAPASALDASAVSVGDALAAEIRDGGLDDETRETLSNAFGPGLSPDQQAQLNRIQSRVEELSEAVAPIDALLDEDEPAVALADLRSDIDDLRADIEALSGEDGAV